MDLWSVDQTKASFLGITTHWIHICCLFCLAHVVNLGVTDLMATITKTATVETMSAIWEYDPMLPNNCVLGDSLDVITAVHTLAIKVHLSFLWLTSRKVWN